MTPSTSESSSVSRSPGLLVFLCVTAAIITAATTPVVSALLYKGAQLGVAVAGSLFCIAMTFTAAWACWRHPARPVLTRIMCGVLLLFTLVLTVGSAYDWLLK